MPSTSGSAVVVACTPGVRGKSAMGMGVGKIVEVEGGHIIRATGLKDRHSKVCTAKGPRDRRVRLAAHTAIQFYDVQDRLGYDRPSKAVDWLIKNAKSAIDQLDQMPPWSPTSVNVLKSGRRKGKVVELGGEEHGLYDNGDTDGVSLLTPSLNYTHGGGGGGAVGQNEDLRLSLQSFQAHVPNLMHSQNHNAVHDEQQAPVFDIAAPIGFDNPNVGWVDSQHQPSPEMGRLHKLLVGWQNHQQHSGIDQHHHSGVGLGTGDANGGVVGGGGFMFNQPLPLFGGHHGQVFTQRGPLQSSNTPSVRTWISDPSVATTSEQYLQAIPLHPQGFSGHGYNSGGFYGFHIPGRIQGEEEHGGDLKPSSASSGSHY